MTDPIDRIRKFIESGQRAQAAANFEIARDTLSKLGIVLTQSPGEYRLTLKGRANDAWTADTLDAAIEVGLSLSRIYKPHEAEPPIGPTGKGRSKRGEMYRHNRKIAATRARRARKAKRD